LFTSTEGCGSATAAEGLIENPIDNYRTPAQQCYQPHDLARLNVCTCGKPANKHANADMNSNVMIPFPSGTAGILSGVGWERTFMIWAFTLKLPDSETPR